MAYGRIRRSGAKIYKAILRETRSSSRGFQVSVGITRVGVPSSARGRYMSYACFRKPSSITGIAPKRGGCVFAHGRTPSNAIGKALKKFGQRVATRGRR